jgi:hypothetical protein
MALNTCLQTRCPLKPTSGPPPNPARSIAPSPGCAGASSSIISVARAAPAIWSHASSSSPSPSSSSSWPHSWRRLRWRGISRTVAPRAHRLDPLGRLRSLPVPQSPARPARHHLRPHPAHPLSPALPRVTPQSVSSSACSRRPISPPSAPRSPWPLASPSLSRSFGLYAFLALLVFAAANVLFNRMLFAWVDRWLSTRRAREIFTASSSSLRSESSG